MHGALIAQDRLGREGEVILRRISKESDRGSPQ